MAGPGGGARCVRRTALLTHEQNAIPWLTNRLLARWAQRVMEACPASFSPGVDAIQIGNPVRWEIAALPEPQIRMVQEAPALKLLVVGGSLGAVAINQAVPAAIAQIPHAQRPEIWHQVGERNLASARAAYSDSGVVARIEPFIDDMAAAYAWADLVLCRAGALTVSEIAAAGVAALLVPYPYAVDDHQTANARWLVDAGGAELIPQPLLTASRLAERVTHFSADRAALLAMAVASRGVAKVDATERVGAACLELAGISLKSNADSQHLERTQ